MEENIVDRLYDMYIHDYEQVYINAFLTELEKSPESGGGESLIQKFNDYIAVNAPILSSYYRSLEESLSEDAKATNFSDIANDLSNISSMHIDDIRESIEEENCYKDLEDEFLEYEVEGLNGIDELESKQTASSLFSLSTDIILQAYKKYNDEIPGVSPEILEQVIKLIKFVQEKKSLKKIYGNNNWKNIEPSEIFKALMDYHKNKPELFEIDEIGVTSRDFQGDYCFDSYIQRLLNNRVKVTKLNFDKYRPSIISSRAISTDIQKLMFARNFIEFSKTGIMPHRIFGLDYFIEPYMDFKVVEDFKKLYNRSFDNKAFVEKQSNFVIDIDNTILDPQKLEKVRANIKGNNLSVGCLMSSIFSVDGVGRGKQYMLVHVNITDVNDSKSTYEIQLNVLPEGKLEHRLQLMRLDNWKEPQYHKNLGNKLQTATHVHLYNPIDLMRGKKNGSYDIAFNIEDESTDFNSALEAFLIMVISNENLSSKLYSIVTKVVEEAKHRVNESTGESGE